MHSECVPLIQVLHETFVREVWLAFLVGLVLSIPSDGIVAIRRQEKAGVAQFKSVRQASNADFLTQGFRSLFLEPHHSVCASCARPVSIKISSIEQVTYQRPMVDWRSEA